MRTSGMIKDISIDYKTHKMMTSFLLDAAPADVEQMADKVLSVELKQYRKKRSLDANSYYWVLCTKVAGSLGRSMASIHNDMLRKYGQIELIDGKAVYLVIPDTETAANRADEAETYHIKPTSEVKAGRDGKMYRTYMMLRGSHDYDTKEMSALIEGVVSEAKELGIETLTPQELQEMMDSYEKHYK